MERKEKGLHRCQVVCLSVTHSPRYRWVFSAIGEDNFYDCNYVLASNAIYISLKRSSPAHTCSSLRLSKLAKREIEPLMDDRLNKRLA